ncbi:hypothetical protein SeLEV6574_g02314 [Synchytrium endobioticum]|uniref:Glycosyltransferase 61 catalytic domain-containing protein n=1 Tax=Synchytrium endobioticum TaxID=286115 RepID=A0A507D8P6_9FUNG|nr:hypothetical protein SeLEV6574_g02314 [Synchytrium endobioticum]
MATIRWHPAAKLLAASLVTWVLWHVIHHLSRHHDKESRRQPSYPQTMIETEQYYYQVAWKSYYYLDFDIYKVPRYPPESLLESTIKLHPIQPLDLSTYSFLNTDLEWNGLIRLTNLRDVDDLIHSNNSIERGIATDFNIVVANPPIHDEQRLSHPPRYLTRVTCNQAYFSEYPFIRDEGYRCMRDFNRGYAQTNWPHDRILYHQPALVVVMNSEISSRGYVRNRQYTVIPDEACWGWHSGEWPDPNPRPPLTLQNKTVLVVTQYWMDNFHHVLTETCSRLAHHYEYLLQDDSILIHVASTRAGTMTRNIFEFLGFPPHRLVTGHVLASRILLPEPALHCGVGATRQVRKLHEILNNRLHQYFSIDQLNITKHGGYILVVKRSKERRLTNHDELMDRLQTEFGSAKRIVVFDDNPVPPLPTAFKMFYLADVIIAPHGAGLGNLNIARKNTLVIEVLTNDKYIHFAFAKLAQQNGLRYFGFSPEYGQSEYRGTITADINLIVNTIKREWIGT